MSYLKYIRDIWNKKPEEFSELMRQRKIQWRKEPATVRVQRPTRLDRARALGWKPKKGFIVVRQRLIRGGRQRAADMGGRKTSNSGNRKVVSKSYQGIAESRVSDKYPNCEVLNSYYLAEDGKSAWFEVILIDRDSKEVILNKGTEWAFDTKGKTKRGLTSSGRKSRGLRKKGIGSEKTRKANKKYN